jgi:hypothetical protein
MSRADDRSHWLGTAIEVRSRISRVALLLLTRTTKLKSFFRNVPSRFQAPNRLLAQPINNEGSLVEPILVFAAGSPADRWILASSLSAYACSIEAARSLLREAKGPFVPTHPELLWFCPKGTSVNNDYRNL